MKPGPIVHPRFATIERTLLKHGDELARRHGAHHIGLSKKRTGGEKRTDTCVTFYVMRKGPGHPGEPVPPYIELEYEDGRERGLVATDVCEIGQEPSAFMIRGGHVMLGSDGEEGTVGLVLRVEGHDLLITNAHVVTDPGVPAGQVRVRLPNGAIAFGAVRTMNDLNAAVFTSDAALVEMPAGSVSPGKFRGTELLLTGLGDFVPNDQRTFFYVSRDFVHALRWSAFVPGQAGVNIDGHAKSCMSFHKLALTNGQVGPGNSGSVIFCQTQGGLLAVGLLFGGIASINEAWAFPIRRCVQSVGLAA